MCMSNVLCTDDNVTLYIFANRFSEEAIAQHDDIRPLHQRFFHSSFNRYVIWLLFVFSLLCIAFL